MMRDMSRDAPDLGWTQLRSERRAKIVPRNTALRRVTSGMRPSGTEVGRGSTRPGRDASYEALFREVSG